MTAMEKERIFSELTEKGLGFIPSEEIIATYISWSFNRKMVIKLGDLLIGDRDGPLAVRISDY